MSWCLSHICDFCVVLSRHGLLANSLTYAEPPGPNLQISSSTLMWMVSRQGILWRLSSSRLLPARPSIRTPWRPELLAQTLDNSMTSDILTFDLGPISPDVSFTYSHSGQSVFRRSLIRSIEIADRSVRKLRSLYVDWIICDKRPGEPVFRCRTPQAWDRAARPVWGRQSGSGSGNGRASSWWPITRSAWSTG